MYLRDLFYRLRAFQNRFATRVGEWIEDPDRERSVFLVLTLAIGAIVGAAIVLFIIVTERLGERLFPLADSSWRRLVVPTITAGVTGVLLYRYFPAARGSGIPQTRAALILDNGRISARTVLGKFFCTATSIAGGIPLVREGPSVHVGAGVASVLGQWLRLSNTKIKQLVPVGASAAVAAAFNTPVAAVLFTLEELMGNLHAPVLGNVVLAAATSWLVLRLFLGNEPLFSVPPYELVHPAELLGYALLGLLGGLISVAFVRLLLGLRQRFKAMPEWSRPVQPMLGGFLVGVLALFIPQVLGSGYRFIGASLVGKMALLAMALLLLLKILTVALAYASGNAGGVFGPALFMGAMTGGCVGTLAHQLFPHHTAAPGAYALVGMGALFAGIVRAPFSSVVMIFELTHDYAIIVPLMVSNLVSLFVSKRLHPRSLYVCLSEQDGIVLPEHLADRAERTVRQVMRPATNQEVEVLRMLEHEHAGPRLDPDSSLEEALEKLGTAGTSLVAVEPDRGQTQPFVVTLSDILSAYGLGREERKRWTNSGAFAAIESDRASRSSARLPAITGDATAPVQSPPGSAPDPGPKPG